MPYPLDEPIDKMGLGAQEAALLTAKARKVTKQQILVLQDVARSNKGASEAEVIELFDQRTGLSLDVADVATIADAFDRMNERRTRGPTTADAACCCTCTPCCSCTASVVVEARA
jgi:hypothetical protein